METTRWPARTCTSMSTWSRCGTPPPRRSPTGTCTACTTTSTEKEDEDERRESQVGREESATQDGAREGQDLSSPRRWPDARRPDAPGHGHPGAGERQDLGGSHLPRGA